MNICAVTQDLNAYQASQGNADAYYKAIDAKARELMVAGEPHYPFDLENLDAAMCEIDKEKLAAQLKANDFHGVGVSLAVQVIFYWKQKAIHQAMQIIDGGCQQCFGSGCPKCDY